VAERDWFHCTRIRVFSKHQYSKEMSMVLLTKCPKLFAGIEEHCTLVEGESKLSKSDVK
jgi:hypothetical protein